MSALSDFIKATGLSNGDLVARAWERRVKISDETIRKARNDDYKAPLRDATVVKLAAALRLTPDKVRELDEQRWRPKRGSETAPELTEGEVLDWLRGRLGDKYGSHIVDQYAMLKDLADAGRITGRTKPGAAPTRSSQRPEKTESAKPRRPAAR